MATGIIFPVLMPTFAPGRRASWLPRVSNVPVPVPLGYFDQQFGGGYFVPGTVAVAGTPDVMVERMVVLFDKATKLPRRAMMSSPDGVYNFRNVGIGPWFVIGFDHTNEYNAVVSDNITGEPM